jgi:hypothetical protein
MRQTEAAESSVFATQHSSARPEKMKLSAR